MDDFWTEYFHAPATAEEIARGKAMFGKRKELRKMAAIETPTAPARGSLDDLALRMKASNEHCEELIAALADEAANLGRLNTAQVSALADEIGRSDADDKGLMRLLDRVHQLSWSKDVLAKAGIGLGAQSPLMQLRLGTPSGVDFQGMISDAVESRKLRRQEAKDAADKEAEDQLLREHPEIARIIARKVEESVPVSVRRRPRIEGSYTGPGTVGHPITGDDDEAGF